MIKIPYGESDFKKLIEKNFFYQDRTHFIPELEAWSSQYQVFLRPRRFGKSLFISILHYYYGLEYATNFQNIFGKYYIGKNPTEEANQYLVLRFEFSRINTKTHETTYAGFLRNVRSGGEKHLQTLMIGLLFPYKAFFIHSEYESSRVYPDIFLERIPDISIPNEVVLELKYVKKRDADTLPDVIQQAENQLNTYMNTERFMRPDVCGFYVIFLGGKVHQWRAYGTY